MRKIIVDIDNTLWDFAPVLYERIKTASHDVNRPQEWHSFDFWKAAMPPDVFYRIITTIHMDQEQFTPYPEARNFLRSLKDLDMHITIASHREKTTRDVTMNWLRRHNLPCDEIHLSFDKTVLFDDSWAVVDDSPLLLRRAAAAGIIGTGLKMPWNDTGEYAVFDTLTEVLAHLREHL